MPNKCPELELQPDLYYDEKEANKYTQNSRMIEIQKKLSERALELCNLSSDKPSLILDIGCGSGLSGEAIEQNGHAWFGFDISKAMLDVAQSRGTSGNLVLGDMGHGLPFRAGMFDACISVSALQWLCNSYSTDQIPSVRLLKFFTTLFSCLVIITISNSKSNGSRAVFQFYPHSHQQIEVINIAAIKAGFTGGIVVDFPNSTKAKKWGFFYLYFRLYLCLFVGIAAPSLPRGKTDSSGSFFSNE
ncbi:hypothetical protein HZS_5811 [Henneguya salminicola]|nr:hypothetical protein HZS_5811 [Henneguya salminicola]